MKTLTTLKLLTALITAAALAASAFPVTFQWAPAQRGTNYNLQYYSFGDGNYHWLGQTTTGTNFSTDTTNLIGNPVVIMVNVADGTNVSAWSKPLSFDTNDYVLQPPTNLGIK